MEKCICGSLLNAVYGHQLGGKREQKDTKKGTGKGTVKLLIRDQSLKAKPIPIVKQKLNIRDTENHLTLFTNHGTMRSDAHLSPE